MPDQHELELFVSEDGEIKIHVKGIKGPGCLKTLEALVKDIGPIKDKELTSEYYSLPKNKNITENKLKKSPNE